MARERWAGWVVLDILFSVIAWVVAAGVTCFFSFLIACVYLVHPWVDPDRQINHRLAMTWGRVLIFITPGVRVEVIGRENIPKSGPVVFMANHQSYTDIPVLYALGGDFKWVAMEALFMIPIFGWAMWLCGYVSLPRGNPRKALEALERAKRWLEKGISIIIFPEGTRSRMGTFGLYQMGGFRLSVAAQAPIVPVVVAGTRQLLPRGGGLFRFGVRPRIVILPALPPPEANVRKMRQLNKQVRALMMAEYRKHLVSFK
jgi:1-acyl-sn-glycerol-3-phosphate acyltransferase